MLIPASPFSVTTRDGVEGCLADKDTAKGLQFLGKDILKGIKEIYSK